MPEPAPAPAPAAGHLADNVLHFARLLRAAGLPVGTDRIQLAWQALQVGGLASRADFHAALTACLLDRIEHRALFDEAFALFWQAGPGSVAPADATAAEATPTAPPAGSRRLTEALAAGGAPAPAPDEDSARAVQLDGGLSWDAREHLRQTDFEAMSAEEWAQARRLLARLPLMFEPLPTRRTQRAPRAGTVDWRATLAAMARQGGEPGALRWRQRRVQPAPLVLLADISGSMSRYSRMLLHFGHALGQAEARVESFVFGTRLTRTTRLLRSRDPDLAVGQVVRAVQDWSGGTRITTSLHEFNQRWARRVLSSQTTVLLITDGLEHGDTTALAFEMARLHKSCRRLIWLNPLLRFARFQPLAAGIKAMRPHCDRFVPAHNLASLEDLAHSLA